MGLKIKTRLKVAPVIALKPAMRLAVNAEFRIMRLLNGFRLFIAIPKITHEHDGWKARVEVLR
jgi:hypothetical protein